MAAHPGAPSGGSGTYLRPRVRPRPPSVSALNLVPGPDSHTLHHQGRALRTCRRPQQRVDTCGAVTGERGSRRRRPTTGSAQARPAMPSRKRVSPHLSMSPRLDLRLRVLPIRADSDHTRVAQALGATLPSRVDGRYCGLCGSSSHRLGSTPTVTCVGSMKGSPRSRGRVCRWGAAQAHACGAQALPPLAWRWWWGRRKRTGQAGRKRSLPTQPPVLSPCPEGHPALRLWFGPTHASPGRARVGTPPTSNTRAPAPGRARLSGEGGVGASVRTFRSARRSRPCHGRLCRRVRPCRRHRVR